MITGVVVEGRAQAEVARAYGVSKGWVSKLVARFRVEGEAAFEPRSRRPHSSPAATPPAVVDLVLRLRRQLVAAGHDAGPESIAWHLQHGHDIKLSRATVARRLSAAGLVKPEPKKRPKSSYIRFQAAMPNECWQSDFTHYRLTRPDGQPGADTEILSWLDDCSRYALHLSAHRRVTGPIVKTRFKQTVAAYGVPASTLTDNGMVYTTRLAGGKRGQHTRNGFEAELHRLHHIGIGRTHARTPVILLVQDLDVHVVAATTGQLLRELTIDPTRDYQPTGQPPGPKPRSKTNW